MPSSAPCVITGLGYFPSGSSSERLLWALGVPCILSGGRAINSLRVQEASEQGKCSVNTSPPNVLTQPKQVINGDGFFVPSILC